jgi:hypothetical protein
LSWPLTLSVAFLDLISPKLSVFKVLFGGVIACVYCDFFETQSILRPKDRESSKNKGPNEDSPGEIRCPHGILLGVSQYHAMRGGTLVRHVAGPVEETGEAKDSSYGTLISPSKVAKSAARNANYSSVYSDFAATKVAKLERKAS